MSKSRLELNREIQEGVNDYEYKKNLRKKNSLTKEEFQKNYIITHSDTKMVPCDLDKLIFLMMQTRICK
jgi:hypothetical protein